MFTIVDGWYSMISVCCMLKFFFDLDNQRNVIGSYINFISPQKMVANSKE